MSTAILELPADMPLRDGEAFSWQIEGVALGGKLVVRKLSQQASKALQGAGDRQAAVESFQKKWSGALAEVTDEEIDAARLDYLKTKHLK